TGRVQKPETKTIESLEGWLTVLIKNCFADDYFGSVSLLWAFGTEKDRGAKETIVFGRHEEEGNAGDIHEVVPEEFIDTRIRFGEVAIHDPVVPNNVDVVERPCEANKMQPSLKQVAVSEVGERYSASEDKNVVCSALIDSSRASLPHMTADRRRDAVGIEIGLRPRAHPSRLVLSGAVDLPPSNCVLHRARAQLSRCRNVLENLHVGHVGPADGPNGPIWLD